MSAIFLKGGTLLVHDAQDHVQSIAQDLLIEGNVISKIGKDIQAPPDSTVIDCRDKIISPGFINTHLHTWETQLRGRLGDGLLHDYFTNGLQLIKPSKEYVPNTYRRASSVQLHP